MNSIMDNLYVSTNVLNASNSSTISNISSESKSNATVIRALSLRDNNERFLNPSNEDDNHHNDDTDENADNCINNHSLTNAIVIPSHSSINTSGSPLAISKRCHSSEKIYCQPTTESNAMSVNSNQHQRGSSLRLAGKNANTLIHNPYHHNFQKIKAVDSPRSNTESNNWDYNYESSLSSSLLYSKLNSSIISNSNQNTVVCGSNSSLHTNQPSVYSSSSNIHHNSSNISQLSSSNNSPSGTALNSGSTITSTQSSTTKTLKFKTRSSTGTSSGGPLIPNYTLKKDSAEANSPTSNSRIYNPRPPLAKRFSSDLEDAGSDIDSSNKIKQQAPKPPISPTRGILQLNNNNPLTRKSIKITGKIKNDDEISISSHDDDQLQSDCELNNTNNNTTINTNTNNNSTTSTSTTTTNNNIIYNSQPPPTPPSSQYRSSLRKNSNSPSQTNETASTNLSRNSPSPTKSVKWNPKTDVKNIPRSHSWCGKSRPIAATASKASRPTASNTSNDNTIHYPICKDKRTSSSKIIKWNESYLAKCTELIRDQMQLLEMVNSNSINYSNYRRKLTDNLESQRKLINHFLELLMSDQNPTHSNRNSNKYSINISSENTNIKSNNNDQSLNNE